MESAILNVSRIHVLRIDPGEDVLESVAEYSRKNGLKQAVVMAGYGTLAAHHLHWVMHNRIPTDNQYGRDKGGIEILSMNGLIVQDQPHIHVTLSTPEGAYGGHLEPGCIAYVLCQVFLAEVDGSELHYEDTEVDIPGMGKGTVPRLLFS